MTASSSLRSSRAKSRDDWLIDLGPDGGDKGGEIVATGTPEQVAREKRSYTGSYLKPLLGKRAEAVAAE